MNFIELFGKLNIYDYIYINKLKQRIFDILVERESAESQSQCSSTPK